MPFYLGLDGGGTKTDLALGDGSRLLARAESPTIKIRKVGKEQAYANLKRGIEQACTAANISPRDLSRTCIGIAGAGIGEVHEWTTEALRELVGGEVIVVGDSVVAHRAAFGRGAGVLVIAGTGSICFGKTESGEEARAGGWGSAVSDEGSGYWIGRTAVAECLRAIDSQRPTGLLEAIKTMWHITTLEEVVSTANLNPPPDFSALLPVVVLAAEGGDALAAEILNRAGAELATLAKFVMRRLWPGNAAIRIAVAGGVFKHASMVRVVFANSLRAERPSASVNMHAVEPVLGALEIAAQGS